MNRVTLREGDYLFKAGDYGGAFIIDTGEVALEGMNREIIVGEGDIVGEIALTGRSYAASARALGHVEATEMSRTDILAIARIPNEAEPLVEALLEKIARLTDALLHKPA